MTTFMFFEIIYYIFFAGILFLACIVFFYLHKISTEISWVEADKVILPSRVYKSVEFYLLHCSPHFPLAALAKIIPGTFVGFGILGTFLGFSNGISGMRLTGSVDELFERLDGFFGGLNTAFVTSIIGVVLSVLFGTLYQWPLNKIKFHCERIYNALTADLTPAESAKNEFDQYVRAVQEMTMTMLAAKESIEMLPQKFFDVGKSLEESIGPIKDTFVAMQATLENYSRQAESLQNASALIQTSLTKFIETSEQVTEKVNSSLESTIMATKDIQENNVQMLEERKKSLADYQEIDEKIGSILEAINKNLSDYSATIEKTLVQTLDAYNASVKKISESFFGEKE